METHDHFAQIDNGRPVSDLERNVYCVLGLPIDAIDMPSILRRIDAAAASHAPFLISTPNLNFLAISRSDPEFRDSVLASDLCLADGMPVLWIARLLGAPIDQRVSGSDIFDELKDRERGGRSLRVFLFGGEEDVAAVAARKLNEEASGLKCVGSINPGFGSVDEMSQGHVINEVNASDADFLAVSLGAKKGQLWLHRNHQRLTIPIRAHLGATINFQAGTVKRAPSWLRACGGEWLWRIKEEPYLWRRYAHDGAVLLYLMLTHILPLAVISQLHRLKSERNGMELRIRTEHDHETVTFKLSGDANERNIGMAIACFQETLTARTADAVVDLARTRLIDGRFLGLLLMVRKYLKERETELKFSGVSLAMRRLFRLNDLDFLLRGTDK